MAVEERPDLLRGYAAIGEVLGMSARQVKAQVEARRLVVFKLGRIVCARRSTLTEWLARLEAQAEGAAARAEPEAGR